MATATRVGRNHVDRPWTMTTKRLDELGWGLFLLLTGVIWLLPGGEVPTGSWLIATGVLLLGMNVVRYINRIPVNVFTTVLGGLALGGGIAERIGVELPLLAIGIVLAGALLIVKPLMAPKQ